MTALWHALRSSVLFKLVTLAVVVCLTLACQPYETGTPPPPEETEQAPPAPPTPTDTPVPTAVIPPPTAVPSPTTRPTALPVPTNPPQPTVVLLPTPVVLAHPQALGIIQQAESRFSSTPYLSRLKGTNWDSLPFSQTVTYDGENVSLEFFPQNVADTYVANQGIWRKDATGIRQIGTPPQAGTFLQTFKTRTLTGVVDGSASCTARAGGWTCRLKRETTWQTLPAVYDLQYEIAISPTGDLLVQSVSNEFSKKADPQAKGSGVTTFTYLNVPKVGIPK